jgi:hypothetical protein
MSERRRSGWRAAVFFAALGTTIAVVAVLAPVALEGNAPAAAVVVALEGNAPAAAVVLSVVSILGLAVLAHRG